MPLRAGFLQKPAWGGVCGEGWRASAAWSAQRRARPSRALPLVAWQAAAVSAHAHEAHPAPS